MKIALVYDRINKWGGAERVIQALQEIWPQAPVFTSVYSPKALWAKNLAIKTSFLQKFPFAKNNHEFYFFLMPLAFENLDLSAYDMVVSITSEAAKGIITSPNQIHFCYCLTPTRYLWSGYEQYFNSNFKRSVNRFLLAYLRKWDKTACFRPDHYVAISKTVQSRIKNYYHQKSDLVYPPVDIKKFVIRNSKSETSKNFFLVVSRLVKYKKVDLVIEAFNDLGWNLKIIGTGREIKKLKSQAKSNIEFLGELTDKQLLSYYQNCKAVIFPQEEDFGLVPLEAQACGKPVIAYAKGGARETIIEGETGLFFNRQTKQCLVEKLRAFKPEQFNQSDCRNQALKFSKEKFKKEFKKIVEKKWQEK